MISETYKLMCRNNPDLQELWKPKYGDRFGYGFLTIEFVLNQHILNKYDYWLPYQEDLQDLLQNQEEQVNYWLELLEGEKDRSRMWLEIFMVIQFKKEWNEKEKTWVNI